MANKSATVKGIISRLLTRIIFDEPVVIDFESFEINGFDFWNSIQIIVEKHQFCHASQTR